MMDCFFCSLQNPFPSRETLSHNVLFFASGKIEFLVKGVMTWIVWKTTFFASGKIEFLVRGTDFGGGKKN